MLQKLTLITCAGLLGLSTYSIAEPQTNSSNTVIDHAGWVQIPGELIHPDCVHEIPNGARVEVVDGKISGDVTLNEALIAHYDACSEEAVVTRPRGLSEKLSYAPGTGNGWVEASEWDVPLASTDNIDYMAGTWTVPSYPAANGALIYLFNGIEPSSENWILQPVLQHGSNGSIGGNYWAIASWLVGPGYAYHSPLLIVYPGQSIFGFTEQTGTVGGILEWKVQVQDTSTGTYSWITANTSGLHWTWAYAAVLEAYNVTSCAEFPSSGKAVFSNSVVYHGYPSYRGISPQSWFRALYSYGGPSCGFNVAAENTSTLYF